MRKYEFITHASDPGPGNDYHTVVVSETLAPVADIIFGETDQETFGMANIITESMNATDGIESPTDAVQMIREWAEQIKDGNSITITPTNIFGIQLPRHFG